MIRFEHEGTDRTADDVPTYTYVWYRIGDMLARSPQWIDKGRPHHITDVVYAGVRCLT